MKNLIVVFVNNISSTVDTERAIRNRACELGFVVKTARVPLVFENLIEENAYRVNRIFVLGNGEFPNDLEKLLRETSLIDLAVPFPTTGLGTRQFYIRRRKAGAFADQRLAQTLSLCKDYGKLVRLFLAQPTNV